MRILKISKVNTFLVGMMMMAILLCCSSQVQAAQDGDLNYTVTDGKAQVTGYTGAGGVVTIPSTLGGAPVTSIGSYAFYDCSGLTSISIPQGVTNIGDFAFYNCTGLTSISIPQGVTSIGRYAFFVCRSLTSISIPQGVTSIGDGAFVGCSGLTSITVAVDNINYASINGVLYNKAGTIIIACPGGLTSISIPQGVTSIGDGAFVGCSGLTSISIPQGVTNIGSLAFFGCSGLTSISIPQGVTSIGYDAFSDCRSLTSISIPQGVTSISDGAFSGCTGLTSISIPQGVTSIGNRAFYGCSGLTSISFNSATTSILDSAYTIPVATKIIGYDPSTAKTYATKYNRTFEDIAAPITVTGVSLNKNVTTINVGANETLSATITPTNATNKNVSWNSSDPAIATVDSNGKVVGVSAGASVIIVTTVDGRKTATCTVTVINSDTSGGSSHTATLDQIVTEIMSYRGYLNPSEKASLNEARSNLLTAVQDGTLSSAADRLLTDQVVAKFQAKGVTRADAKVAIIKSLQGFQAIHYSDDNATIERALVKFKTENGKTFRMLFGDDFKVELFYGFMMATQDGLQKEIKKEIKKNPSALLGLVGGSSTEIKDKLVEWLKTALHNVADPANSKYHVFDQKLADMGWNIDLLVETQRKVGAVIDPSNAAEKAMAMSVIRSQIQCKINGIICDPLNPLTLKKGDNKLKLDLSVKGIDTGGFKLAGLLAWKTDNSAIATIAEDGSSIKAGTTKGTTVITAYRMNDSQVETNELIRITVAVN